MKASIAVLLLAWLVSAGCELREITLAEPADVLVAEVILQEGAAVQTAYLHRTRTGGVLSRVLDATIVVTDVATGSQLRFEAGSDTLCLEVKGSQADPGAGTCYSARGPAGTVRPGARYTVEITLEDGRRLSGATTVPGAFRLVSPPSPCSLEPDASTPLVWTQAAGAAVYIVETRMAGLLDALRDRGVEVPPRDGALELIGISVGAADTTMTFPGDIGLFSRADESLHAVLLAIRDGLPSGVTTTLVIGAADRNYVNWVRGGNFNPSGAVRVPSLSGDGTGVFGSVVTRQTTVDTNDSARPPCG